MKSVTILINVLVILTITSINAQEIKLGFKVESNSAIVKETETGNTKMVLSAPTSIGINFSVNPINRLDVELRGGFDFNAAYFTGNEIGLFARYLIANPVYVTGGVLFHDIFDNNSGTVKVYSNALVIFPALGIGVNINDYLGLELTALYGNNFKAGYTERRVQENPEQIIRHPVELNWVTKLGICYTINL